MTNLDKWKAEKIKEIEDMNIDDVVENIMECNQGCDYCEIRYSGLSYKDYKGFCEEDCFEGIKAYLDMEVE